MGCNPTLGAQAQSGTSSVVQFNLWPVASHSGAASTALVDFMT